MKMKPIYSTIKKFHNSCINTPNHRYKSWEHCHKYFQNKNNRKKATINDSCLQLGFYLASWGMYRGSSFLLKKDYKVHQLAVKCLFQKKYDNLWNADKRILKVDKSLSPEVVSLSDEIKEAYLEDYNKTDEKQCDDSRKLSTILSTKIILGTMGCCPAYDDYFNRGIKGVIDPARFGVNSYSSLLIFVDKHSDNLIKIQNEIRNKTGNKYPIMKLVDMYFWQIGFDRDNN